MIDWQSINFAYWPVLFGLLMLPVIWYWMRQRRKGLAVRFSSLRAARAVTPTFRVRLRNWLPSFRVMALFLLILAAARPQKGNEYTRVQTRGIAIMMTVDISGSMEALDFRDPESGKQMNRLEIVKKVFTEFVMGRGELPGRPNDRVGLVAYAGYADARCPLTLDHGALTRVLEKTDIPDVIEDAHGRAINPEDRATAIGDGIAVAVDRLKEAKEKSRVMILLSDGVSNAGLLDPIEAAELAKTFDIKIYTIGIGRDGPVPYPVTDRLGNRRVILRPFPLDEETLKGIADITGGKYFHASNAQALKKIYSEIDKLEKTEATEEKYLEYFELFGYFVLPALGLLLFEQVLGLFFARKAP